MTLEERVERLERRCQQLHEADLAGDRRMDGMLTRGMQVTERLCTLEAQLEELDVMVLAIHEAIRDVQARV
jgi:hypothetical protein